jgi:predicted amidohydrolase
VRIAAIQHDIAWEDPPANFSHLAPMIAGAATAGARLVVLTEMFATGFSMDTGRIAEPVDGPSACFLAEQARTHGVWVSGSIPERATDDDRPSNCLVLAGPDGTRHRYAKIHPFSYAGEHKKYAAGDQFLTVVLDDLRASVFICYDLRFADEFWVRARDTDLYVVPANWPSPRVGHWRALLRARAIENQAYVLGVNRVGNDPNVGYPGASALIDPAGTTVIDADDQVAVLVAEVDAELVRSTRRNFPFLADRR